MCGKERVYRHLPERVKRQFGFVQDIPRPPSDVPEIPKEMLATVLKDPCLWFYSDGGRGVIENGTISLATWLGMPKSLTLGLSHLMKDLLPGRHQD